MIFPILTHILLKMENSILRVAGLEIKDQKMLKVLGTLIIQLLDEDIFIFMTHIH